MAVNKNLKPRLTGILADKEAWKPMQEALKGALEAEGRRIVPIVKRAAPTGATGKLAGSVKHKVSVNRKRARLQVDATATRKATPGEGGSRGSRVPYGVFTDHETGWMKGTFNAEEPAIVEACERAIDEMVKTENKRVPAP